MKKEENMRRWFYRAAALALFLGAAGCAGKSITVDLRHFPNPIMVSPIMRIGDKTPPTFKLPEYSRFSGESSMVATGSQNQRVEGNYVVTETRSTRDTSDNVAYQISLATSRRPDLVVVVDELRAGNWAHASLVAIISEWVGVKGRTFDPKAIEWRGK